MLRLAAASGVLDVLQTGGMDAEDLLHLERFGYEPSPKTKKRSKARGHIAVHHFSFLAESCYGIVTYKNTAPIRSWHRSMHFKLHVSAGRCACPTFLPQTV